MYQALFYLSGGSQEASGELLLTSCLADSLYWFPFASVTNNHKLSHKIMVLAAGLCFFWGLWGDNLVFGLSQNLEAADIPPIFKPNVEYLFLSCPSLPLLSPCPLPSVLPPSPLVSDFHPLACLL